MFKLLSAIRWAEPDWKAFQSLPGHTRACAAGLEAIWRAYFTTLQHLLGKGYSLKGNFVRPDIHKIVCTMQIGWQERPGQKPLLRHQGCSEALTSLKTLASMEFSRSLSSKRSSAAIELCPSESLPFTQLLGMQ